MQCNLPFVKGYRDRHGTWRYYLRRRGQRNVALPGKPGSVEFLTAYHAALEGSRDPARGIDRGSFEALCRDFKASAAFSQLAETTRREMGYVITALCKDHGAKPVDRLARRHIQAMKDALKDKPGACNKMLRTLKVVLGYAVDKEYRKDNPAERVKLMKLGRHRAWQDDELGLYEAKWPLGSLERIIFDTALYSGQRAGDLPKIPRTAAAAQEITLTQRKTGKDMVIRVHANWRASMEAYLPTHKAETLIAGREGKSIHQVTMAAIFREAKRAAGVPADCVLHGLRKTTARILAELGQKSSPITGHVTRAMQDEYERDASQKKLGSAAILSWEKASKKRVGQKQNVSTRKTVSV